MTDEEFKKAMRKEREQMDEKLEKEIDEKRKLGEIPTNEQIISMIPSKAVREYLVKIGHIFSERDREILRRYIAPKNDDEFETVFEKGRYVSVPHPFRKGDIVAAFGFASVFAPKIHEGEYSLGIMRSFESDTDWQNWDEKTKTRLMDFTDFSDVSTTVEFLKDDGTFSHDHPNPIQLEFASDIPDALTKDSLRTKHLETSAELLKGDGSLELYEMTKRAFNKNRRTYD